MGCSDCTTGALIRRGGREYPHGLDAFVRLGNAPEVGSRRTSLPEAIAGLRDAARRQAPALVRFLLPRLVVAFVAVATVCAAVWSTPSTFVGVTVLGLVAALVDPRVVALAGSAAVLAVGLAMWPAFTLVVAAVIAITLLAWGAPAYAFVLAVVFFGAEGSIKASLSDGEIPLPLDPVAVGAALADLAFFAALVGVLVAHRAELPLYWRRLPLGGRLCVALLAAWLVVSVLQIVQGGDLARGMDGFRLTQAYVAATLAGLLLFADRDRAPRVLTALLVGLGLVAAYAAMRAISGPAEFERLFALSRPGVPQYGGEFRDVGSFSGAVGLTSYLVPAGVFALTIALLVPRHRVLSAIVFGCSSVAVVASYTRAGLIALGVGLVVAVALTISVARFTRRALWLVSATALALALVGGSAAVYGRHSPEIRERLHGFVDPLGDESIRLRLDTWRESLRSIEQHPLGTGLGTVGRASSLGGEPTVTTDNSYLKVAREQGLLGVALFLAGIAGACWVVAKQVRRLPGGPVGVAAVAAFVSFLVLAFFGEYVEQPGKVLAWTLLGIGAWQAWGQPVEARSRLARRSHAP